MGILEVEARTERDTLVVVVTDTTTTVVPDDSASARPRVARESEDGRGLPIMEAVADELEVQQRAGTQTELRFSLAAVASADVASPDESS